MEERRVLLEVGGLNIEGLLNKKDGEKAVVITHPHPLYGGDMHNNVVEAIMHAYSKNGYSTFRFNFRGVGGSEGRYDEGIGEQDDVKSALLHLKMMGKNEIHLAGYSFGAWVNAMGLEKFEEIKCMIMISPPVNFVDFSFTKSDSRIGLVIAGSEDEIAPPAVIKKMIRTWNPEAIFREIAGADHFYLGKTIEIVKAIDSFISKRSE